MLIGVCYLIQGLSLLYIYRKNHNKHVKSMGRSLIIISIINFICYGLAYITKYEYIKSIGTLSIIIGLMNLLKITKELREEQELENLKRDSIRIIEKLTE